MKKGKHTCPGCSRHCSADTPRCKYGRKYFAAQAENCGPQCHEKRKAKHKWERFVEREDVLWQLFSVARKTKKALVRGKTTREELLNALTASEQESLRLLLGKLESPLKNEKHV